MARFVVGAWCVVAVATWGAPARALSLTELAAHAHGRVAHLSVRDDRGDERSSGSCFVISKDGRLATNYHVIDDAENIVAVFSDKREVKVTGVWGFDKDVDIAVLQLEPGTYTPLQFAREPPHEGEDIVLIGSPLGLGISISSGIVSAVREQGIDAKRYGNDVASWSLQITAAAAPGSSGSPIMRSDGEVVGVLVGHIDGLSGAHFGIAVEKLRRIDAAAPRHLRPLEAATGIRTVSTNLLISGSLFAAVTAVWLAVSTLQRRRLRKRRA